jgi:hypothetical protein
MFVVVCGKKNMGNVKLSGGKGGVSNDDVQPIAEGALPLR